MNRLFFSVLFMVSFSLQPVTLANKYLPSWSEHGKCLGQFEFLKHKNKTCNTPHKNKKVELKVLLHSMSLRGYLKIINGNKKGSLQKEEAQGNGLRKNKNTLKLPFINKPIIFFPKGGGWVKFYFY